MKRILYFFIIVVFSAAPVFASDSDSSDNGITIGMADGSSQRFAGGEVKVTLDGGAIVANGKTYKVTPNGAVPASAQEIAGNMASGYSMSYKDKNVIYKPSGEILTVTATGVTSSWASTPTASSSASSSSSATSTDSSSASATSSNYAVTTINSAPTVLSADISADEMNQRLSGQGQASPPVVVPAGLNAEETNSYIRRQRLGMAQKSVAEPEEEVAPKKKAKPRDEMPSPFSEEKKRLAA